MLRYFAAPPLRCRPRTLQFAFSTAHSCQNLVAGHGREAGAGRLASQLDADYTAGTVSSVLTLEYLGACDYATVPVRMAAPETNSSPTDCAPSSSATSRPAALSWRPSTRSCTGMTCGGQSSPKEATRRARPCPLTAVSEPRGRPSTSTCCRRSASTALRKLCMTRRSGWTRPTCTLCTRSCWPTPSSSIGRGDAQSAIVGLIPTERRERAAGPSAAWPGPEAMRQLRVRAGISHEELGIRAGWTATTSEAASAATSTSRPRCCCDSPERSTSRWAKLRATSLLRSGKARRATLIGVRAGQDFRGCPSRRLLDATSFSHATDGR